MRIATFNLWNSPPSWPRRQEAVCEELSRIEADVVALQEVPSHAADAIAERTIYAHSAFRPYPEDPEEGLAFLSKHPFLSVEAGWETPHPALQNCGLRVRVGVRGTELAVTNVHLEWSSIAAREAQILEISKWIASRTRPGCQEILCGDFNCYPESSVYRFLMGQQTLAGGGVSPWHDLAAYHAHRTGTVAAPTLDFATNPRWKSESTLSLPARVDWILLAERGPGPMPAVSHVELFGLLPTPKAGVIPSDHYGVLADIGE